MAKPKKCKQCGEKFTPQYSSIQMVCSPKCAAEYSKKQTVIKEKKEWEEEKKVMLEKFKTMGDYEAELQKEVNEMVRLIDRGLQCISCGNMKKQQAGHYHSRSKNTTIRFNLHNIHIQDYYCNVQLSANITGYNLGLINWYGKEYQEYVEYKIPLEFPLLKWTKNDLILWIALARTFKKELSKLDYIPSPQERLELRTHYNNKLGIYNSNLNQK